MRHVSIAWPQRIKHSYDQYQIASGVFVLAYQRTPDPPSCCRFERDALCAERWTLGPYARTRTPVWSTPIEVCASRCSISLDGHVASREQSPALIALRCPLLSLSSKRPTADGRSLGPSGSGRLAGRPLVVSTRTRRARPDVRAVGSDWIQLSRLDSTQAMSGRG